MPHPLRRLSLLLVSIWVTAPSAALASDGDAADVDAPKQAPKPTNVEPMMVRRGLQLGARLGYGMPSGPLSNGSSLSTSLSNLETGALPIGIDAGYRLSPGVYLGATLAWAPGLPPNSQGTCPTNASCFRQDAQLRAEARFYFAPERKVGGWASIGAGWEVAAFSQSAAGVGSTATLTGPVLADFEVGFDVRKAFLAIGPYFGLSLAEFLTHGQSPADAPVPTWINDPSPHVWMTVGLRGAYGPW